MIARPQSSIRFARDKAVLFLLVVTAGCVVGVYSAEEDTTDVAVLGAPVGYLAVVGADIAGKEVGNDAAAGAVTDRDELEGRIALADLAANVPISASDLTVGPTSAAPAAEAEFRIVVVPLVSPPPTDLAARSRIELRSLASELVVAAVFLDEVEPGENAPTDGGAVGYARVLIDGPDAASIDDAAEWLLLSRRAC